MVRSKTLVVLVLLGCNADKELEPTAPVDDSVVDETDDANVTVVEDGPLDVQPSVVDVAVPAGVQRSPGGLLQRGRACVAADFDLDGRIDLYVGNPGDDAYVMRNETEAGGDITFRLEQTLFSGPLSWGAAGSDYDNDGDIDLFISVGGNEGEGYDHLFQNQLTETGTFSFVDVTEVAGIAGPLSSGGNLAEAASANGTWADFDRDGDNDLFVNTNVLRASGDGPLVGRNVMWRNNGDGTFTDVTEAWTVGHTRAKTHHSTAVDIDNDGDLDLFENNFRGFNVLWRNLLVETGEMRFADITDAASGPYANLKYPRRSFVSVAADFNNDGWEDLLLYSRGLRGVDCGSDDPTEDDAGAEGHALLLNLGPDRGFVDVAEMAGINAFLYDRADIPMLGDGVMGSQVGDVNADGYVDIFVGNGGPDVGKADHLYVLKELRLTDFGELGEVSVPIFEDWTHLVDYASEGDDLPVYPYRTHGSCLVDFDGDGLVELFVANGGPVNRGIEVREPDRLFKFSFDAEDKPDHLKLQLRGDGVSVARDAVGSKVALQVRGKGGALRTLHRRLYGGSAFSAHNSFDLFFGLGHADVVEQIEVTWLDGLVQTVDGPIAPNQTLEVTYGD